MNLTLIAEMLESYNGRDKILRLIHYGIQSISGLCSNSTSTKLNIFGDHVGNCRTFLRLFDDIPMLNYTLKYGLGEEEPDILMQLCGIGINAFDQIYYPLEHIAWAADNKLISLHSARWWNASTICWTLSLYLNLCKSFRYFTILQSSKQYQSISNDHSRELYKKLSNAQLNELLTMARCLSDLLQAIHWLPDGILWSGRLKTWQIGVLGSISSFISLYQSYVHSKSHVT